MNSYDINSKQIYFYVVQDQQVVGRYFKNISGAINHIQMYSSFQKEKRPKDLTDESFCMKLNNRAIIPVHNCIALHPHSIEGICALSQRDHSYWENDQALEMMQCAAEQEHRMMMPRNDAEYYVNSDNRSFKDYRQDVRDNCISYFEQIRKDTIKNSKNSMGRYVLIHEE